MGDNETNDNFSEYIDYRNVENESLSGSSKLQSVAPSTSISQRSSFSFFESTAGSSQQQQIKKLKLSKPEKSFVWKYFKKIDDGKVQCIIPIMKGEKEEPCNIIYKHSSSTSNMKYHLNAAHNKTEGDEEKEESIIHQTTIDSMFSKARSHGKSYQHKLNTLLLEFIITDSQPFHILKSKGFRKLLFALDPSYSIPCDKTIKNLITEVYKLGVKELLTLVINSCEFISITTDLWTARSKTGYIGITGHWVNENFKPYDILIGIKSILYPHTAVAISSYLEKYIEEYRLENKIVCVVTDNGSNMKAAVNILNQKNDKIQRLPCVAHTLQLTVIKALKSINKQVKRYRKLVKFFQSPKQSERLQEVQNELNKKTQPSNEDSDDEPLENLPTSILKNINEVPTRWNSKYNSWKRLIELKKPIIRLNATLHLEDDKNDKLDGERLQKIMLCEEEWVLLSELCSLFKPFDEVTTYFSGVEYATISSILPIIQTLKLIYKNKLKDNYDINIEDLDDNDDIDIDDNENMKEILSDESEEDDVISDDSESDEASNEPMIIRPHKHNLRKKTKKINYSETTRKSQNILENTPQKSQPESANSDQIIKRVLGTIIKSLNSYWQVPNQNALISTILDPRYKDLEFLSDDELQTKTEINLQNMYDDLKFELNPNEESLEVPPTRNQSSEDSIFNVLHRTTSHKRKKKSNEVDNYLNESITEKADPNINPFEWWNHNRHRFPILSILARKYLSIPATSVPSERLFSDAGNSMTNKQTRLSPKFFQEILFIKRNSKYIDMFSLANKKK
ncbi:zinc finger BED domain-containing protein 4-like [Rhizophagus irregularis DAOM 181602=DAOM 197198]|nr:zinc finger BED domain-containing protein 4-like [Rhizophagus irregularis DAOM 181602=DAOM 197198]